MAGFAQTAIREPGADTPRRYVRRVKLLAATYLALCVGALAGLAIIIWKAQLFVTLSQRSNVETLTLAFLFVFFAYVAMLSVGAVEVSTPPAPGEPYRVEAAVRNTGTGHGEVAVTIRLRDRASGQTFQDDRKIRLEAGETARVVADIQAPPGSYEPQVEVEYPPR